MHRKLLLFLTITAISSSALSIDLTTEIERANPFSQATSASVDPNLQEREDEKTTGIGDSFFNNTTPDYVQQSAQPRRTAPTPSGQ